MPSPSPRGRADYGGLESEPQVVEGLLCSKGNRLNLCGSRNESNDRREKLSRRPRAAQFERRIECITSKMTRGSHPWELFRESRGPAVAPPMSTGVHGVYIYLSRSKTNYLSSLPRFLELL